MRIIAYTYEADTHCVPCTQKRKFKLDAAREGFRQAKEKDEHGVPVSAMDKAPCIIAIMGNAKEWPVEARANAALIVQAVNERESLLAVAAAARHLVKVGDVASLVALADALDALDKITKDSIDKKQSTE